MNVYYYMKIELDDKWAIYKYDIEDNIIMVIGTNVSAISLRECGSINSTWNNVNFKYNILTEGEAMLELL